MSGFLELRSVSKAFDGVQALSAVDLEIKAGEICCLLGENGSGKSSLIKTLSGIYAPDSGEIAVDGVMQRQWRPIDAIHAGIDVIYQDFSLFPNLTVGENLTFPQQVASRRTLVDWRAMREAAARVLRQIDVVLDLDLTVEQLSVAQRQLVAIARTLMRQPRLIVMDEPTSALTANEIENLLRIIGQLRQRGVSVLFVSHKLDEVVRVAEHVVVLRNGCKVFEQHASRARRIDLVRHMVGRDLPEGNTRRVGLRGDVLLEARGLGRRGYYRDLSFKLHAGEILGVTGQLDSGRTALALSLYGMLPPDAGELFVHGSAVRLNRVSTALANGIALVPEDRLTEGLFLPRSVGANISAAILPDLRTRWGLLDARRRVAEQVEWLRRLSIKAAGLEVPVSTLSGGNQQRVVLAKALARRPRIVVLNGPTVGVDVGSKDEIHGIIEDLGAEGLGVILVSDDGEELQRLCDRVLVMTRGRIAEIVSGDALAGSLQSDGTEHAVPQGRGL